MNRQVMCGALGLGVAVLLIGSVHDEAKAQGKGNWMTDYNAARAEAKKSGKPMFLVFR